MVAFDASFLSLLLHSNPKAPFYPKTQKPVDMAKERVEQLLYMLERGKQKIIIPTPALSEVLVLAVRHAQDYLAVISANHAFEIAAFDERAAVEAANMTAKAMASLSKRDKTRSTLAKIKFDRQIVAIAKTRGVDTLYSNDNQVRGLGESEGIEVRAVWDLPEPPPKQVELELGEDRPKTE